MAARLDRWIDRPNSSGWLQGCHFLIVSFWRPRGITPDPRTSPGNKSDLGGHPLRPQPPTGKEKNSIKTVQGKGWFPIYVFYSPTEASSTGHGRRTTSLRSINAAETRSSPLEAVVFP